MRDCASARGEWLSALVHEWVRECVIKYASMWVRAYVVKWLTDWLTECASALVHECMSECVIWEAQGTCTNSSFFSFFLRLNPFIFFLTYFLTQGFRWVPEQDRNRIRRDYQWSSSAGQQLKTLGGSRHAQWLSNAVGGSRGAVHLQGVYLLMMRICSEYNFSLLGSIQSL